MANSPFYFAAHSAAQLLVEARVESLGVKHRVGECVHVTRRSVHQRLVLGRWQAEAEFGAELAKQPGKL